MEDDLLTVNEIAALLKLNQQTVRSWIDRGELPAVRVGQRRVRVKRSDLDGFLADRAPPPAPAAEYTVTMTDEAGGAGPSGLTFDSTLDLVHTRAHRHLLNAASEHVQNGLYQEAIVIAQAAAEACAARAITALLAQHPEALRAALETSAFGNLSNYNLVRDGPRNVWNFLAGGDVINTQPFWARYKEHTERRNRVAHNTAPDLTEREAEASLKSATAFIDHVESAADRILGRSAW